MSEVPVELDKLELIVQKVARNLLEKWAIEDRFTEETMIQAAQDAVDDTAFVINDYMSQLNDVMSEEARKPRLSFPDPAQGMLFDTSKYISSFEE